MRDPWLRDEQTRLYHGDALEVVREMADESVDTVVTSPPYWGLRDYGIDGQMGLEETPDLFVAGMVELFREIRRVLAPHGTCWVNLGDSYAANRSYQVHDTISAKDHEFGSANVMRVPDGLKPKDLVGIPWRVAFALQADGWCLRSDIVWSKPNPMPESVTDRPTKAHEMVFLLTKAKWIGPERGQFAHISEEDARWLALLFDTEGNIVIKRAERDGRTQFGAQVAFANTSRHLLERAQAIVGAGSIHERKGVNAPVFYWQMGNRQARDLLYRIAPHLIVKQRQARVAIHMHNVVSEPKKRPGGYRTPEHEAFLTKCWETVKSLNNFGDPDISWVPAPKYGKWGASRYWFDTEAVREPANGSTGGRIVRQYDGEDFKTTEERSTRFQGPNPVDGGRNVRSVWQIATQPYPEAHFATFPEELARRCILAGCPTRVCRVCGKPSERIVERGELVGKDRGGNYNGRETTEGVNRFAYNDDREFRPGMSYVQDTVGWSDCGHNNWRPGVVLDPFIGSGTTAKVARDHQRHAIGIDLNAEYLELAGRRAMRRQKLTLEKDKRPAKDGTLSLFGEED